MVWGWLPLGSAEDLESLFSGLKTAKRVASIQEPQYLGLRECSIAAIMGTRS